MKNITYIALFVIGAAVATVVGFQVSGRGARPALPGNAPKVALATGTIQRPVRREDIEGPLRGELDRQLAEDRVRATLEPLQIDQPKPASQPPKAAKASKAPKTAKAYRWKDAEGVWHLSDSAPPEGVAAEVISLGNF